MQQLGFADKLEVMGLLVGAFLVLVGLGTISGTPWVTADSAAAGYTQVLGAVIAIGIGVALAWLTRTSGSA